MKRFLIPDAEALKTAAKLLKDASERRQAQNVATVWSAMQRKGMGKNLVAYIELGRKATLLRESGGTPINLGDMQLTKTREFVRDLKEMDV